MNCFAELYARWPEKMGELCMELADAEGRRYCYIHEWPLTQEVCVLCPRTAFDDGYPEWRWRRRCCDSGECIRLWEWIMVPGKEGGARRRQTLKKHFNSTSIWEIPHLMRREAILTTMLLVEAQEKERANGRKPRLRMVA